LPWIGRRGCTGLPDRARKICLYFVFNEKPLRYPAIAQTGLVRSPPPPMRLPGEKLSSFRAARGVHGALRAGWSARLVHPNIALQGAPERISALRDSFGPAHKMLNG